MDTTIKVSQEFIKAIKSLKEMTNQSYEEILWDLIEPYLDYSPETKKQIEISKKQEKKGETFSLANVKSELGFS